MSTSDRIKVLLVENTPQIVKHLNNLLNLIAEVELIAGVGSGQEALDGIKDSGPNVVILEVNLPDTNGLNLIEPIRKEFPSTQVITISKDKDYNIMLRAIRSGSSDFLTHDVTLDELKGAILRAAELSAADKIKSFPSTEEDLTSGEASLKKRRTQNGKIISVYSPKGGSGVTSLAINLAIALQDKESIVAVVDGSMQFGDVPVFLNELSKFSVLDLVPRIQAIDAKMIEDVMIFHKSSGLHILPAPPRPELAEQVSGTHLNEILEYMRQMFSFIVVNTSAYINDPCLAALDASDVIVLLTTQEISAIRGARAFLHLWESLDMSQSRILLVINRYNKQLNITAEKVGESLKHPVVEVIPVDDEIYFRAANYGIPFMVESKESSAAKGILSIAEMVHEKIGEVAEEDRVRLFGVG